MERDFLAEAIGPLPFPSFFTEDELARLLNLNLREIRGMIRAGKLPSFWLGREYRVLTKDLLAWLLLQRDTGGESRGPNRNRRTATA